MRYYDLRDDDQRAAHAELIAELHEQRLPLPAVFLDNQLLYAGAINPLRVVAAVAEAIERSRKRQR